MGDVGGVGDAHPRRPVKRRAVFVSLGQRFRVYFEPILAAIELGISNALNEGINDKIRLISARGYGHHSAQH